MLTFIDSFIATLLGLYLGKGELSELTFLEALTEGFKNLFSMPLESVAVLLVVFLPVMIGLALIAGFRARA